MPIIQGTIHLTDDLNMMGSDPHYGHKFCLLNKLTMSSITALYFFPMNITPEVPFLLLSAHSACGTGLFRTIIELEDTKMMKIDKGLVSVFFIYFCYVQWR